MTSFSNLLALAAALSIGAAALPGAAAAEGRDTSPARSHKMTAARITPQQLVPLLAESVGPWQRVKVQTPAKRPGPSAKGLAAS